MSVTEQTPRNISTAVAGATLFPYSFKIIEASDLLVQVGSAVKTLGVDYTVSGAGDDAGGNVVFAVPMVGGEVVTRRRNMQLRRLTDFQNLGDLRSSTMNNDQDAPILMIQQVADNALSGRSDQSWDAKSRQIVNLAAGAVATDAANLGQVTGLIEAALDGVTDSDGAPLLRADLASAAAGKGDALIAHGALNLGTVVTDLIANAEFGLGQAGINTAAVISDALQFLTGKGTDNRGETLVNGLRRSVQLRRAAGSSFESSPEVGDDDDEAYTGRLNSTAVGFYLLALAEYTLALPNRAGQVRAALQDAADWLLVLQWNTTGVARYGGMKLAPDSGNASCFGTAVAGRALFKAYRATNNARYLTAARKCADFLLVLKEPNATYGALYGETPIPAYTANGTTFTGFCDRIDAADVIAITSSGWNAYACVFLKELGDFLGNAGYTDAAAAALPFYVPNVQYAYDFFAIKNAAPSAHVAVGWVNDTNLDFADHGWHRLGELVVSVIEDSGTLVGATANSVTLPASASAVSGAYIDRIIQILTGPGSTPGTNAKRKIIAYDGTTKVALLDRAYTAIPDATSTYRLGLYPNTMGTDQLEYALYALYHNGYDPAQLLTWYTAWASLPNATPGTFADAYDGRRCLTGYIRVASPVYGGLSKAFGTYYDSVGAAILLPFKQAMAPADYAKARNMCLLMPSRGALLDENFNTIYGTAINGVERATKGTLPVAEAMIALLETL